MTNKSLIEKELEGKINPIGVGSKPLVLLEDVYLSLQKAREELRKKRMYIECNCTDICNINHKDIPFVKFSDVEKVIGK